MQQKVVQQHLDHKSEKVFTIFKPVYKNETKTDTVHDRQKNIIGFVSGTFKTAILFKHFVEELKSKGIELSIFDHTEALDDINIIHKIL